MAKGLAAHLIDQRGIHVCSVCLHPFATIAGPSLKLAFRKHVEDVHSEKRQREAASEAAAARAVKEAAEEK